ncbi:MAG: hypothetical protein WAM78_20305 [Candidatus Sulfotelmatobacter sp.]
MTPWKTITQVNAQTFSPGDSILFKRGDVWNESLVPPSSGTSGNPIVFDAYGTGAAPNLTGYYAVPSSAWVHVSGNAWKSPLPATYSTINFCLFGSIWGQKVAAASSNLTAQWNFYFANGYVYVYSVNSPATYYNEAIVPMALSNVPVINVNGQSWLTFQHFLVNWFDQYGVYVQGTSDHLVFANMEADSMIPQGAQPLGFYVDESAPGPGSIKIYNSEAHLNYDGFRIDGTATAITMVNDKGYANRDGALVDNTGAVTYSYCHFYASSLAVAGSTDVEWTSGSGPTAGTGNIAADTAPAVQVYQRYPANVTLTVDDSGMTPGADSYYAGTVLPIADAAGVPVGAAITVGYPLAQTLVSEFQGWINAGRDVTAHSISHTYYTNLDALDIQYTGSGTAATLSISDKALTITVTGAADSVSYNLAQGQAQGTILGLKQALATTGKFTTSFLTPCQGPYGTGCSAYTAQGLLAQDLADVSGQNVKTSAYHMQLDVTRLTTDEITLSRQWMTTNLTGLPATPVYVYPGGYETTTMQGITEGVPYSGARGALKEDLGVKDTYADGFNVENITSFGVNPSWMGLAPSVLNQKIQALVWKEAVWGVPWGIFWHWNATTEAGELSATEVANLIADFKESGATIQTNTGLVNWLLSGTQETGTDGNDYYTFPATSMTLDFRPTNNSPVVDAGENLGTAYELDINGVNQNSYGSGWEFGAHVYQGYGVYGEGGGSGTFALGMGSNSPVLAKLPQVWVNNNEAESLSSYELSLPNTWITGPAPDCTFHTPYWGGLPSQAGLQAALVDIEACRTATGAGIVLDVPPALYTGTSGVYIPQSNSTLATSFLVVRSTQDASLPNGRTACAHGIQDNLATSVDIGIDNPDCAGDAMYYQLGTSITTIPEGAFTLANGQATNTSGYNDVQYMWTLECSGSNCSALTACSPLGASSSSIPPACTSTTLAPDHWLIEDMEARMSAGNTGDQNVINLTQTFTETSPSQYPTHIHFRKIWQHGDWTSLTAGRNSVSAGISFACSYCSILDSQTSQNLRPGAEGHSVLAQGPGPYKINHNWFEGQSSAIFAGGWATGLPFAGTGFINFTNVEIRRNRLTFPYSWLGVGTIPSGPYSGQSLVRKNVEEIKEGELLLYDGNILENADASGGQGGPIADFNVRNCSGCGVAKSNYQAIISDLTFTNNIGRNSCEGFEFDKSDIGNGGGVTYGVYRAELKNNLFYNISDTNPDCANYHQGVALENSTGNYWQGTVTENSAGTGATFVANCSTSLGTCIGQIASATVSGCSAAGTLTFSSPNIAGGVQATGTFNSSCVVTLTNPGSGYTSITVNATSGTASATINASSTAPTSGFQVLDIFPGDPAAVTMCPSSALNNVTTATFSTLIRPSERAPLASVGSAPWNGTPTSSNLTVSYPWTATANLSDSSGYCTITSVQGGPEGFSFDHNTVVTDATYSLTSNDGPTSGGNYQINTLLRDSVVLGNGWNAGQGSITEGKPTESFNYDYTTMSVDHMVWPTRTASNYTEYGNNPSYPDSAGCNGAGCSLPNTMYFPGLPYCTGATSTSSCVGFAGAMSATSMPLTLSDYHGFELRSDSVFSAGQSEDASDGTAMGANIPVIDSAETQNVYICLTPCGAGPYADTLLPPSIPNTFFGMHVNRSVTGVFPYPTIPFGSYRTLDSSVLWSELETSAGTYDFTRLNARLAAAQAAGVDVVYTIYNTPSFHSSNPTDMTCATTPNTGPGGCDPPVDINPDGSGTDASLIAFLTALVNDVGGQIKYYEIWNEVNITTEWTGTNAQLLRMAQDARATILALNPNAMFLSPSFANLTYASASGLEAAYLATSLNGSTGSQAADIINFHGYVVTPALPVAEAENEVVNVNNLRAVLSSTDLAKPLWDTEFSYGPAGLGDPDLNSGFIAKHLLIQAGQGIARAYYFDWDITEQEALWSDSADFGTNCLNAGTPNDGGYLCETGIAYQQVETWLLGNTVTQPCSGPMPPAVGVWTCRLMLANGDDAMVLWDSSKTCSGGTCTTGTYTSPGRFSRYLDLSSGSAQPITNNTVAVGVKPMLLLLPSD